MHRMPLFRVAILAALLPCVAHAAEPRYSICLERTSDQESASAKAEELKKGGYVGARSTTDGSGGQVLFGAYRLSTDAHLALRDLRDRGFADATVTTETVGALADVNPVFNSYPEPSWPPLAINNAVEASLSDEDKQEIERLAKEPDTNKALASLRYYASAKPETDAAKGEALLRCAYLELRLKQADKAEADFQKVAEGRVAATSASRLEAATRYARLIHRRVDRLRAYSIWKSILDCPSVPEKTLAEARLEAAGLLMELARSGKGSLKDFREFCDESLSLIPNRYSGTRSTIELMSGESYYFEGRFTQSRDALAHLTERLTAQTKPPVKVLATAYIFRGMAEDRLGNYESAKQSFLAVTELPIKAGEGWKDIPDMKGFAVDWLIRIAKKASNEADLARFESMKETGFAN